VLVHGLLVDDHGGWPYSTVVATAAAELPARAAAAEVSAVRWVPADEVGALRMHPGFAERWPLLRTALEPLTVVVDGANVVGSRPDGWWRDRAAAARRLRDQLAGIAAGGVGGLPGELALPALDRWFPRLVLVVEGAASSVAGEHDGDGQVPEAAGGAPRLCVTAAPRSGDDEIAALAATLPGRRLVVTADRELRARCAAAGAAVTGPGWLLGLL
jgi:hypothetical protein